MIALLSYIHTCFIRSYRFGPPSLVFIAGIIFVYSVKPNPVMESYAFSVSFLFVISSAISYVIMELESNHQEAITMTHTRSIVVLYVAKLLYSWLFTVPFALLAVVYPAALQLFDRNPTVEEIVLVLLYHLTAAWLAITVTCWFSSKFIRSRLTSFLLLSLLIVLTFSARPIIDLLPGPLKAAGYLLPPLERSLYVLFHYEATELAVKWLPIGAILLYGMLSTALYLYIVNKRKLDAV